MPFRFEDNGQILIDQAVSINHLLKGRIFFNNREEPFSVFFKTPFRSLKVYVVQGRAGNRTPWVVQHLAFELDPAHYPPVAMVAAIGCRINEYGS